VRRENYVTRTSTICTLQHHHSEEIKEDENGGGGAFLLMREREEVVHTLSLRNRTNETALVDET
jgi:hypothetical protein